MSDQDDALIAAQFDRDAWDLRERKYGMSALLRLLHTMQPIPKPESVRHLKFLRVPTAGEDGQPEKEPSAGSRRGKDEDKRGGRAAKAGYGGKAGSGRYVPDMGHTESVPGRDRGQWWRNKWTQDVLVKTQCTLQSDELSKIPPRHYVLQSGPVEVFIDGPAKGLQRMPVQPRGWVTVDATQVQGPRYLEPVAYARWKVLFSSGMPKGDIVVRETVKLESQQVAVLFCNSFVDQSGPTETLEDEIVRMPIQFVDGSRRKYGWVTLDASKQGGPVFFEPATEADERTEKKGGGPGGTAPSGKGEKGRSREDEEFSWDKNRIWTVTNLGTSDSMALAVVKSPEPFAPGSGKTPGPEKIVKYLRDGDVVEQVGHSKKMRGYMIMPVRIIEEGRMPALEKGGEADGWVTRRLVDKQKQTEAGTWFKEMDAAERKQARSAAKGGGNAEPKVYSY